MCNAPCRQNEGGAKGSPEYRHAVRELLNSFRVMVTTGGERRATPQERTQSVPEWKGRSARVPHDGPSEAYVAAVLDLIESPTKAGDRVIYITDRTPGTTLFETRGAFDRILRKALDRGFQVVHLWYLEDLDDKTRALTFADMMMDYVWYVAEHRMGYDAYKPLCVQSASDHDLVLGPRGAVLMLRDASGERQTLTLSETAVGELRRYVSRIQEGATKVAQFFADVESLDLELLIHGVEKSNQGSDRFVAQRGLSALTRPACECEVGTPWRDALINQRRLPPGTADMIAKLRKERVRILREELESGYRFRVVCSKAAMQQWLIDGTPLNVLDPWKESEEARLERLSNIINMLQQYPNFEVGFADDETDARFGWIEEARRELGWELKKETMLVGIQLKEKQDGRCLRRIHYLTIGSTPAANAFGLYAERLWSQVPSESRTKEKVLAWLEKEKNKLTIRNPVRGDP